MNDDDKTPSPETIRAVAKVLRYASFLDDRIAAADKGRVEAWSRQIERHGLIEVDMMSGLQKYYDGPHDRAIGIGDLIACSRGERRERNEREEAVERERRENERDAKLEAETKAIAAGFTAGPIPASVRTDRLGAAERALQACHGKHESRAAIAEYMEARQEATKNGCREEGVVSHVRNQQTAHAGGEVMSAELEGYHTGHQVEGVDLNQVLSPYCLDTSVELAWDQWARIRIFCMHGTAEGVSGGLCLNEAFQQAIKSWQAMNHDARVCYEDCPPPASYIAEDPDYWGNTTSECELMRGHAGDCEHFDDDDDVEAYRYARLTYFKNGHDRTGTPVFGSTEIPHPYKASAEAVAKRVLLEGEAS